MEMSRPPVCEPYLLTPGPLSTAMAVKKVMLRDWGSWDSDFNAVTAQIRARLLAMSSAGHAADEYECILMQGSGTFALEAALSSFIPRRGKVLVLINGAYGHRAAKILKYLGRSMVVLDKGDYLAPQPQEVDEILAGDANISHVFIVHCETSSGILNPLKQIADIVHARRRRLIIDAMSSFGAIPLDVSQIPYEAMVSSANKCIEGVPGFGFVIATKSAIEAAAGRSHSLSLDLHDQWKYMQKTGQWRFTPPTHAVVAFREALHLHEAEGGIAGRLARYTANMEVLVAGMRKMGFETLLDERWLSPIITTFLCPADAAFEFKSFYEALKARNFIIYPGKLTRAMSFRIGCIGQINPAVMEALLGAVKASIEEMGVKSCAPGNKET